MLLVENHDDKTYGIVPMEGVREIGLNASGSGQGRFGCALVQ
jgi:hypothetical protein